MWTLQSLEVQRENCCLDWYDFVPLLQTSDDAYNRNRSRSRVRLSKLLLACSDETLRKLEVHTLS